MRSLLVLNNHLNLIHHITVKYKHSSWYQSEKAPRENRGALLPFWLCNEQYQSDLKTLIGVSK
jgi:hypothetical protein